jgi:hypothetical protein
MAADSKKTPAKKATKKAASKKAAPKTPGLGKTVNVGPTRGDSSWPPGSKPMSKDRSRTVPTKAGSK